MMNLDADIWSCRSSPYGPFGLRGSFTTRLETLLGLSTPHQFRLQQQFTEDLIRRLGLGWELKGHEGCVNCLEWNCDGSMLASGSDDCRVRIWDPFHRTCKHVIATGHTGNIFGVRFLPGSSDNVILSCAADGTVRVHDLNYTEILHLFSCHANRAKRIATSVDSPSIFWSAGEDGLVIQYDLREPKRCDQDSCRNVLINLNLYMSSAEVKSIASNPVRSEYLAIGASDCFTRLYDRRMLSVHSIKYPMLQQHNRSLTQRHLWLSSATKEMEYLKLPSGCVRYFAPGHLPQREVEMKNQWRSFAITDVRFSPDGADILSNIGGEQIYLFAINSQDKISKSFVINETSSLRSRNVTELNKFAEELKSKANEYYHDASYNSAVHLYNRALLYSPQSSVLYSNRSAALMQRAWDGDAYQALLDAYKALLLDPDNDKAQFRLIKGLSQVHRYKEARVWLDYFCERHADSNNQLLRSKSYLQVESDILSGGPKAKNGGPNGHPTKPNTIFHPQESTWKIAATDYEKRFLGHCNTTTDIKEANFLGQDGQFIMAGSDDGSFFIWDRQSTNPVKVIRADTNIVNCLQSHPVTCMVATSGIDSEIRLWVPLPNSRDDEDEETKREAKASQRSKSLSSSSDVGMEVEDVNRATNANQRRMNADPWSFLLGNWQDPDQPLGPGEAGPNLAVHECAHQ